MKHLFSILLVMAFALNGKSVNPSFQSFDTNSFLINGTGLNSIRPSAIVAPNLVPAGAQFTDQGGYGGYNLTVTPNQLYYATATTNTTVYGLFVVDGVNAGVDPQYGPVNGTLAPTPVFFVPTVSTIQLVNDTLTTGSANQIAIYAVTNNLYGNFNGIMVGTNFGDGSLMTNLPTPRYINGNIIYTNGVTISTTNGSHYWSGPANCFAGFRCGWNFVPAPGDQYMVVDVVSSNKVVTMQAATTGYTNKANSIVYPNNINFGDINNNQAGWIGNDGTFGSIGFNGIPFNSGSFVWSNGTNSFSAAVINNGDAPRWQLNKFAGGSYFGVYVDGANDALNIYSNRLSIGTNIVFSQIGAGIQFKEGSNARMGTATLNGTTAVVVANTSVTANSRIWAFINLGSGTVGSPYVSARSVGTSFSLKSTTVGDTSTVAWFIAEPAP